MRQAIVGEYFDAGLWAVPVGRPRSGRGVIDESRKIYGPLEGFYSIRRGVGTSIKPPAIYTGAPFEGALR